MVKYNFEYKISVKNDAGIETKYVKRVIDETAVSTEMSVIATSPGIEFVTLRKVAEKPPVKKILKETK